ncbi:hypothetical protein B0F90DRAFT_1644717 [Multifurca ochricompacta]|uniref:SWI/SNF and RSC complexes subunit Ssr4 N-terminal domain-containing protein n=1 Tax=Multifurca ochricompacta TaxID=376703 RepID=A0AAD4LWV5_9AGAM|nr:hypothetical protein B0F90DRAFT_1644717 [Multifurca ochricompacta]
MSTSSNNILQAEGLCLRFPENLPPHSTLTHEVAVSMLARAVGLATQIAFQPSYIDKPPDGQIYLLFIPGGVNFPLDGVRYMENEQRYSIPIQGGRELEIIEARHGLIPLSGEMVASRVRRRYRLVKGGHPYLVLVHYSRGQSIPVPPALQAQPVRQYPLRPHNEQAVFVLGERQGHRVPPTPTVAATAAAPGVPPNVAVGGRADAQAILAQQNREMEALERRSQRERSASMNPGQPPPPPQRLDEEDSADELEHISTRTLALTRYGRNHELMNEVFMHAAFGDKHPPKPPAPFSIFDKAELENRVENLNKEIEELRARSAARRAARDEDVDTNMTVDGVTVPSVIVA